MALIVLCMLCSDSAIAQQSTITQQILEPECATLESGCEMKSPTIDSVDKNGNRPIIMGTYDAAFSKYLRVTFGARTYTLGVDEQIKSVGSEWRLDLSKLLRPLEPGMYELLVEAEGYDGGVQRAKNIVILSRIVEPQDPVAVPSNPDATPEVPEESEKIPKPMSPEEAKVRGSLIPLLITLLISVALIFLIGIIMRRGRSLRD